jgi:signal transduction histidine kinase
VAAPGGGGQLVGHRLSAGVNFWPTGHPAAAAYADGVKLRGWWPTRRAAAYDAVLIAAVAALEVVLELHAAVMTWEPAVLPLRILVIATVVLLRRRMPLLTLAIAVVDAGLQSGMSAALPVAAYALTRSERRWSIRIPALVVTVVVTGAALLGDWGLHTAVIISVCFVIWPATLGAYQLARTELVGALLDRVERAETAQHLLAEKAVLEERARIAGEMHDVVGHRVSLMVLHAGAMEMAAADSAKVTRLAEQVQAAGRQALQELRHLVGLLRDGGEPTPLAPQPTLADLPALVEESRRADMTVRLELAGKARPLAPMVERTAYRVVQEALTNAGRHAPGAPVRVKLTYRPTELAVRVDNRMPSRSPITVPGGGHGLVGLRERAHALGGWFTAAPAADGGFGVEAVLPV